MSVLVVLLLIGLAATLYMIVEQRGGVDAAQVSRPTKEIVQLALTSIPGGTMSMHSSWMSIGQDSHSAGFTYRRRKSILVASSSSSSSSSSPASSTWCSGARTRRCRSTCSKAPAA